VRPQVGGGGSGVEVVRSQTEGKMGVASREKL